MARSTEALVLFAVVLSACGDLPSKKQALEIVTRDVRETAVCTLDVKTLTRLKMQYSTKAACVPKESAADLGACVDALVAAGVTKKMPAAYMRQWPDEVAGASLGDVSAYERRARELVFASCVELSADLREGRFSCGKAHAKEVLKVTTDGEIFAIVRYERAIDLMPDFDRIEQACGGMTKPPVENTVPIEKTPAGWAVPEANKGPAPSFLPSPGTKSYH